jgi:DNA-binding HxlR family transcriptional regulator
MARTLEVIGERWTLLLIRDAFYGVRSFSDFRAHLDIPKGILSDRLSGLVQDGIFTRRPDPAHRGRQLYELTAAGRDLWPVVSALLSWGSRHRRPNSRVLRHAKCGTLLDERGHCPSCDRCPAPGEIVTEPRPGSRREKGRTDPVAVALREPHRLLEPLELR